MEELASFPDLLDSEASKNSNSALDIFMEDDDKKEKQEDMQTDQPKLGISDNQIEPEINKTVEKIADDIIVLTHELHEVVDDLHTRNVIHQNVSSDSITERISRDTFDQLIFNN